MRQNEARNYSKKKRQPVKRNKSVSEIAFMSILKHFNRQITNERSIPFVFPAPLFEDFVFCSILLACHHQRVGEQKEDDRDDALQLSSFCKTFPESSKHFASKPNLFFVLSCKKCFLRPSEFQMKGCQGFSINVSQMFRGFSFRLIN